MVGIAAENRQQKIPAEIISRYILILSSHHISFSIVQNIFPHAEFGLIAFCDFWINAG